MLALVLSTQRATATQQLLPFWTVPQESSAQGAFASNILQLTSRLEYILQLTSSLESPGHPRGTPTGQSLATPSLLGRLWLLMCTMMGLLLGGQPAAFAHPGPRAQ